MSYCRSDCLCTLITIVLITIVPSRHLLSVGTYALSDEWRLMLCHKHLAGDVTIDRKMKKAPENAAKLTKIYQTKNTCQSIVEEPNCHLKCPLRWEI